MAEKFTAQPAIEFSILSYVSCKILLQVENNNKTND